MKLESIPIEKIRITENHRTNIEDTHLSELMQSIKQHGLLQPVGVAPVKGGYILKFGQRRYLACKKLGYKTIEAMVGPEVSEQKLLLENITENVQRKDSSFAEMGRAINQLKKELTVKEISVRLGLPEAKINQIVKVYESLPEKFRSKVMFMERGGGRKSRKGFIPAQVAIKIVNMKKEHGLKDRDISTVFTAVKDEGMDNLDLNNVGELIGAGLSAEKALERVRAYGVFVVEVCVKHSELAELCQEYQLMNRQHLFKKILYGELPPLKKPDFVTTGPKIDLKRKGDKIVVDPKPFQNKLDKLLRLKKDKKLDENQVFAIDQIVKIKPENWNEGQRLQIERMFNETVTV